MTAIILLRSLFAATSLLIVASSAPALLAREAAAAPPITPVTDHGDADAPSDRSAPRRPRPGHPPAEGSDPGSPDHDAPDHDAPDRDGPDREATGRDGDPTGDEPRRPDATHDGDVVVGELDTEVTAPSGGGGSFQTPTGTGGADATSGPAGHVGPGGMKAGVGCSVQCITSGVAYARGVNVRLVLTTDTPALMTLGVYGASPASYDVSSPYGERTTRFALDLTGLQPGTTYQVLATATDADGHTSYATGSFTTLRRTAEVVFHANWSVTQTPHDTRFHYHYRVDGDWRDGLTFGSWPFPYPPALLPQPVTVTDADRRLDVAVQVVAQGETHSGLFTGTCPVEAGAPPTFGPFTWPANPSDGPHGTHEASTSEGCAPIAWATARRCDAGVDLDARPADATSWTEHTLVTSVSTAAGCASQPLTFTVGATIEVRYVE